MRLVDIIDIRFLAFLKRTSEIHLNLENYSAFFCSCIVVALGEGAYMGIQYCDGCCCCCCMTFLLQHHYFPIIFHENVLEGVVVHT